MPSPHNLTRRAASEALGTAALLLVVVGSGIMGEQLAGGNVAVALLANTLATGFGLLALLLAFGPISGAHFNPVVSLSEAWQRRLLWRETPVYIAAQAAGAFVGVALANSMFGLPVFARSTHVRTGTPLLLSEALATFGLLLVIGICVRRKPEAIPAAVPAYVMAAYWCTSSSGFANPAVTLARAFTESFAGIQLRDVPWFIGAQLLGAACAVVALGWLVPAPVRERPSAP
jgi:glycerol uptake facilitator-like aquaporin